MSGVVLVESCGVKSSIGRIRRSRVRVTLCEVLVKYSTLKSSIGEAKCGDLKANTGRGR